MEAIAYMIQHRLNALVESPVIPVDTHLDEDTICAFVEGRLGQAESSPIVSHLIACGPCRSTTAQLIRLESHTADELDSGMTPDNTSSRLHSFFESLASRIIPPADEDVVFAYQSPVADQETEPTPESTSDQLSQTKSAGRAETHADQETDP